MEDFAAILNEEKSLTTVVKFSIVDAFVGLEYVLAFRPLFWSFFLIIS